MERVNLKNFFNNKFDIVFSIGEDCACTSYLRRCNLQHNSYPFDWLTNAPFENRISLIHDNFSNFINLEYLKPLVKKAHNENEKKYDLYENILNGLHFYHDFPANVDLKDSYQKVYEKYQRRIERLYNEIENSEKILFVWLSHSKLHSNEEIIEAYKKLCERFKNKEIYLLVIENSLKNNITTLKNNQILIVHHDTASDDKKHHYDQTMGNKTNNLKIFKKIKLKTTLTTKIKRILYIACKNTISIIPHKKLRNQLKQDLNMFFYHAKL